MSLVLAIALKDAESVARILYRVGTPDSRANLMAFSNDIEAILGRVPADDVQGRQHASTCCATCSTSR